MKGTDLIHDINQNGREEKGKQSEHLFMKAMGLCGDVDYCGHCCRRTVRAVGGP